jgi:hypothetical protein
LVKMRKFVVEGSYALSCKELFCVIEVRSTTTT